MDKTIITAIIGSVTTFLSPIVTLAVKKWLTERSTMPHNFGKRIGALNGQWKGTLHQSIGPEGEPMDFELECNFKVEGIKITGTGSFYFDDKNTKILIKASPTNSPSIIKFEYTDEKPEISRYGAGYSKLSANADVMNLKLTGYASEIESLVHVEGKLEKIN